MLLSKSEMKQQSWRSSLSLNFAYLDPTNKQSLHYLETCWYVLCLDDSVTTKSTLIKNQRRDSIQIARMEPVYMASMLLHGGGSEFYTANRWYDKFLQVGDCFKLKI